MQSSRPPGSSSANESTFGPNFGPNFWPTFWKERWNKREIGFHLDHPHERLVQFADRLPSGKMIVPLCGKTQDLLFLRASGHHVVGAELSSIACQEFFEENKIPFSVSKQSGFSIFRSGATGLEDRIELWCGDFFETPAEFWSGATALYDRAALIALPPELRRRYATKILQAIKAHCPAFRNILMITLEYPEGLIPGPPFSVTEVEVSQLFSADFSFHKLSAEELPDFAASRKDSNPESTRGPVFEKTTLLETSFR